MARPRLLNPMARASIAKSYLAGVPVSEIAHKWGVSMSNVINWAKEYEVEMMSRRLRSMEARARKTIVPPPIQPPDPGEDHFTVCMAEDGTKVSRLRKRYMKLCRSGILMKELDVSLPYVSIQHGGSK
ncbi:MAG TPA: hypothetical protein VEG32_07770 [Clostridia bacterium]|nr:hypothetical protein [Clostridia bacterium]